jgi:eukaryotic-like serine/threonine-protein kinase
MSAAENLTGKTVSGERYGGEWTIGERIQFVEGISPGHHSVGYKATDNNGRVAFLKATDLRLATDGSTDFLGRLKLKVDAHTFERSLLDHVKGANLDRVVIVLDYGSIELTHDGAIYALLFLVLEFAEKGDLRHLVQNQAIVELVDLLNIGHNIANAISQLHSTKICHNDIKPGNCLIFNEELQKLGDLGRATTPNMAALHDVLICAGDPQYAAPEQLYGAGANAFEFSIFDGRRVGDIYSLGSMLHFLLCKRMITPELFTRLSIEHRPVAFGGGWSGTYVDALPFVRAAWASLMDELKEQIPIGPLEEIVSELISIVETASDPDPRRRGVHIQGKQTLSVERYISRLDHLRKHAAIISNA